MSIPPKRVFCLPSRVCHWPSLAEEDSVASSDVVPNAAGAASYGGGNAGGESVGGGKSQTDLKACLRMIKACKNGPGWHAAQ